MRTKNNPEKEKLNKISYVDHRIIIPLYIPSSEDEYFKGLFKVFKLSIESLLKTINLNTTKITVINNDCKKEVTDYIQQLLESKVIDKHIILSKNYGKVYPILKELKSLSEPYVTVADADVYYFNGWINETTKIFNSFKKVGVVCPLPTIKFSSYNNNSLFSDKIFSIKRGKILSRETLECVIRGIEDNDITKKINKAQFQNQYYIENKNVKACVGAGHFISTYKSEIFRKINDYKVTYVFKGGDENLSIDKPIDKLGYYRVSTSNFYVYHMGNVLDDWILKMNEKISLLPSENYTFNSYKIKKQIPFIYKIKSLISRFNIKRIKFRS